MVVLWPSVRGSRRRLWDSPYHLPCGFLLKKELGGRASGKYSNKCFSALLSLCVLVLPSAFCV